MRMQLGKERTDVFRYRHCCNRVLSSHYGQLRLLSVLPSNGISLLPDQLEDFRFLPLPFLHALLHGCDDTVRLVLSSMFRTLLSRSCKKLFIHSVHQVRGGMQSLCLSVCLSLCPLVRRLLPRKVQDMFTFCIEERMVVGGKFIFVHIRYIGLKYNFLKLYTTLRSVSKASSAIRQSVGRSVKRSISKPIRHFFDESVSHSNSVTTTANH